MNFPYPPGKNMVREFKSETYDAKREASWQAINAAYYAWVHGRADCLWPTPGAVIDAQAFRVWKDKFLATQKQETMSRGKGLTRPILEDDWPDNLWRWLYERLMQIKGFFNA
ncbi:hypothetical protein CMI37_14400 [Candidatus Pacearchaeota archaeon]|nr:hypothetical protein [Candidatus Pacearchaeota archaeon]